MWEMGKVSVCLWAITGWEMRGPRAHGDWTEILKELSWVPGSLVPAWGVLYLLVMQMIVQS